MMRHMTLLAGSVFLASLLAGCGGSDTTGRKESMKVEDTVFGDQVRLKDKVREDTSRHTGERMDKLNKQLEGEGQ